MNTPFSTSLAGANENSTSETSGRNHSAARMARTIQRVACEPLRCCMVQASRRKKRNWMKLSVAMMSVMTTPIAAARPSAKRSNPSS